MKASLKEKLINELIAIKNCLSLKELFMTFGFCPGSSDNPTKMPHNIYNINRIRNEWMCLLSSPHINKIVRKERWEKELITCQKEKEWRFNKEANIRIREKKKKRKSKRKKKRESVTNNTNISDTYHLFEWIWKEVKKKEKKKGVEKERKGRERNRKSHW